MREISPMTRDTSLMSSGASELWWPSIPSTTSSIKIMFLQRTKNAGKGLTQNRLIRASWKRKKKSNGLTNSTKDFLPISINPGWNQAPGIQGDLFKIKRAPRRSMRLRIWKVCKTATML
jgi:hypothetical protein